MLEVCFYFKPLSLLYLAWSVGKSNTNNNTTSSNNIFFGASGHQVHFQILALQSPEPVAKYPPLPSSS